MVADLLPLLRCTKTSPKRCLGALNQPDKDRLECTICGAVYPVRSGIPMMRQEIADTWYEGNYARRSRTGDLAQGFYSRERDMVATIARREGVGSPSLDIGCGTGIFAEVLPGFVGLEYSYAALRAEGFEGFPRVCGTAETLPFRDSAFGLVFSINALEHVPDLAAAFGEADRVLHPGGLVILKPAWHCVRSQTELIPIRPYRELCLRQKFVKATLPISRSRAYKFITRVPWRLWRHATAGHPTQLRWDRFTPNHQTWIADADASSGIDCHEGILYFTSRGYHCLSHGSVLRQLLAGHDWVVLRKPA